ncbi:MAG: hypothetical protein PHD09_03945 [Candidatus Omnitrophica bacterium]|jgi:hypothetical protein|nr:hypothetical protein [Candidatus Omnitrophota bacterium]
MGLDDDIKAIAKKNEERSQLKARIAQDMKDALEIADGITTDSVIKTMIIGMAYQELSKSEPVPVAPFYPKQPSGVAIGFSMGPVKIICDNPTCMKCKHRDGFCPFNLPDFCNKEDGICGTCATAESWIRAKNIEEGHPERNIPENREELNETYRKNHPSF